MADVETKEVSAEVTSTETPVKESPVKKVTEVVAEPETNGQAEVAENGDSEATNGDAEADGDEAETNGANGDKAHTNGANGDSTTDKSATKRKSAAGDVEEETVTEKKSKAMEDAPVVEEPAAEEASA